MAMTRWVAILSALSAVCFSHRIFAESPYRVVEGDTLTVISLKLYGNAHRWRVIADRNHLAPPYDLHIGDTLEVPAPTVSAQAGRKLVVAFWNRKLMEKEPKPDEESSPELSETAVERITSSLSESRQKFQVGRERFDRGEIRSALPFFHDSRVEEPSYLPPWFYEIRSLRLLGDGTGADRVTHQLLEGHPELEGLPLFHRGMTP